MPRPCGTTPPTKPEAVNAPAVNTTRIGVGAMPSAANSTMISTSPSARPTVHHAAAPASRAIGSGGWVVEAGDPAGEARREPRGNAAQHERAAGDGDRGGDRGVRDQRGRDRARQVERGDADRDKHRRGHEPDDVLHDVVVDERGDRARERDEVGQVPRLDRLAADAGRRDQRLKPSPTSRFQTSARVAIA